MKGQPNQALVHDFIEPSEQWHRSIAHVHYREIPIASKVVSGLPKIQTKHEGICKGCVRGNNIKKTLHSSDKKTKGLLDIIHSDVYGPMSSNSLSGYVYYVSFIDDFSRNTWIYFLKSKNEVFSKFMEYKALVVNQTDRKIKTLWSYNSDEFTLK